MDLLAEGTAPAKAGACRPVWRTMAGCVSWEHRVFGEAGIKQGVVVGKMHGVTPWRDSHQLRSPLGSGE